jgi:hypothetical protein
MGVPIMPMLQIYNCLQLLQFERGCFAELLQCSILLRFVWQWGAAISGSVGGGAATVSLLMG